MRVGLSEEAELKIARFIKGLSPNIANKVELQPYLPFDDLYNLDVKVKKQFKSRKPFLARSINWSPISTKEAPSHLKAETTPIDTKTLDKCKAITGEPPKRLEGKKCFKCYGYGHFQTDCLNRKTLTIKEVEEIKALKEETSDEEFEEDDHTLVTLSVSELFEEHSMSKRLLVNQAKGIKFSILNVPLEARCVTSLLIM